MIELVLSKKELEKALSFYEIDDKEYILQSFQCLSFINENKALKEKVSEIFKILYCNINSEIRPLWKKKNPGDLFGEDFHPFTTNILLLLGYRFHKENIVKYELDKNQISIHKQRVKECLTNDIYNHKLSGIRISQLLWGVYFINIRLIEVGRLQYEYYSDELEKYINIHIPAGKKLIYDDVISSLKKSKKEINKYFKLQDYEYYCKSWLLSKQIYNLVDKDSNISKFQNLFEIEDGEDCIADILNFVYGMQGCKDLNVLKEKTQLQRNIKKYLMQGNNIYIGIGKLKKEYLQFDN